MSKIYREEKQYITDNHNKIMQIYEELDQEVRSILSDVEGFDGLTITHCRPDGSTFDITFSGNKAAMLKMWSVLRARGWSCSSPPPEKGTNSWSGFWENDKFSHRIFLCFYSTVCKRVQVGTKTQEVPVYETVCDELGEVFAMTKPTLDEVMEAVQADDNTGFCLACGYQQDGVEPDARNYECENCGRLKVYGAEECLIILA